MAEEATLTIRFENKRPVDLLDLASSLQSFAARYTDFARDQGYDPIEGNVRLFIKELRTGSIIAELSTLAEQASFVLEHKDVLAGFVSHVNELAQFFLRFVPGLKAPVTRKEAEQLSRFVEPVAKDAGSQLFLTVGPQSQVTINQFHINSEQANAIQNGIRRFAGRASLPDNGFFRNELLYIHQARDALHSRTGDLGVIERFSDRPVKLRFLSEDAKRRIIDHPENPFKFAFLVDGRVSTVEGKPALYEIFAVHDVIERP